MKHLPSLSRINTFLVIAIICINGYVIVAPLIPALLFRWQVDPAQVQVLEHKITHPGGSVSAQGNRLIIPSIYFDEPVLGGVSARVLNRGVWLRPQGADPDQHSNTVIAGHRFTYTNPRGSFYHLNKVHPGDHIGLFWKGIRYSYTVTEVKVVPANQTDIEQATTDSRLTLYTCTPLWLPKDRLVVIAEGDAHE